MQKDYGGTAPKPLGTGDVRYLYDGLSYGYDGIPTYRIGWLASLTNQFGSTSFEYDWAGRVKRTYQQILGLLGSAMLTEYVYDSLGRIRSIGYPDNVLCEPDVSPCDTSRMVHWR